MRKRTDLFQRPGVTRWLVVSALFVAARFAADFGTSWLRLRDGFSLWYPPAGLDVALLCIFGPWYAPAVAVAQTIELATASAGVSGWILAAYLGLQTALYAAIVVVALTRLRMDPRLTGLRDVVVFVVAFVFVLPTLAAIAKVPLRVAAGLFPTDGFAEHAVAMAVGEATGIAMVAPLLLLAVAGTASPGRGRSPRLRMPHGTVEWLSLLFHAGLTVAAVLVSVGPNRLDLDLSYVIAVPVIWAALSHGFAGAVLSVFAVNNVAALVVALGIPGIEAVHYLFGVQMALFAISSSGVLIGGLVGQERDRRMEAESATRKFYGAFRSSPAAIVLTRAADALVVEVNDAYTTITGVEPEDIIGSNGLALGMWTEADVARYGALMATGSMRNQEFAFSVPDGRTVICLLSSERLEVDGEQYFLTVAHDVTERRRLERDLVDASEHEQQRLGRELHDHLGQSLSGIAYLSQSLAARTAHVDPKLASQHALVSEQLGKAIRELRSIAHGLDPSGVTDENLCSALETLAHDVSSRFGVGCSFHADADVATDPPGDLIHIYRIAQEATTNAIRHGKATLINVSIRGPSDDGAWSLIVEDNGSGIPENTDLSGGLGIRNMRFRASQVGGKLSITPTGSGTRVHCSFDARSVSTSLTTRHSTALIRA